MHPRTRSCCAGDLAASMGLDCSDVLAVRLWLDRKVLLRTPSNVVAGFDEGVGGTLFQLDDLQVSPTELCECTCAVMCIVVLRGSAAVICAFCGPHKFVRCCALALPVHTCRIFSYHQSASWYPVSLIVLTDAAVDGSYAAATHSISVTLPLSPW
jgi:hypothetical protein